jgi:hypothetical protein
MTLYHKVVEANQWKPGVQIDGVWLVPTTIHYDVTGEWYYITHGNETPRYWYSVKTFPGPLPEEHKKTDTKRTWIEVRQQDGTVYHREIRGFIFWELKHGEQARLDEKSDLFIDYAIHHEWKVGEDAARVSVMRGSHQHVLRVNVGDWVVRDQCGNIEVMKPEDFHAQYRSYVLLSPPVDPRGS